MHLCRRVPVRVDPGLPAESRRTAAERRRAAMRMPSAARWSVLEPWNHFLREGFGGLDPVRHTKNTTAARYAPAGAAVVVCIFNVEGQQHSSSAMKGLREVIEYQG